MAFEYEVSNDVQSIPMDVSETQSTVIAPRVQAAVLDQRSSPRHERLDPPNDNLGRPGTVVWRDLGQRPAVAQPATFDMPPNRADYHIGQDHDLIVLNNGDVLYSVAAVSTAPLNPKPAWFDAAYNYDNYDQTLPPPTSPPTPGPGARVVTLTWRSTDGGQNLPVRVGNGRRGHDRRLGRAAAGHPGRAPAAGSANQPIYCQGGSDGQLTRLDPATGWVYLTHWCTGQVPDASVKDKFALTDQKLAKTLLCASLDGGDSWTSFGFLEHPGRGGWRCGVVPRPDGGLVLATQDLLILVARSERGNLDVENAQAVPVPGDSLYNGASFYQNPKLQTGTHRNAVHHALFYTNVVAHTVVARGGDNRHIVVASPSTIVDDDGNTSHGSRLRIFYLNTKAYGDAMNVLPETRNENNFVLHLTAVNLGTGPVLSYWLDVNLDTEEATARGLFVRAGGVYTEPFAIPIRRRRPHLVNRAWR